MSEHPNVADNFIATMRGWNELQYRENPQADPIIDIDVAPPNQAPRQYEHLKDIRSDLEDQAGSIPEDEQDREAFSRAIQSSILFLRALDGEKFDYEDYVEGTIGFRPQPVTVEQITASAQVLDELLAERGMLYDSTSRHKYDELVLRDEAGMQKVLEGGLATAQSNAKLLLGEAPELNLTPEYISKEGFGVSEVTGGSGSKLRWTVNTHPSQLLTEGRLNTIAAHEITGHGWHIEALRRAIQTARVNRALGITAMHLPYAFQAEALAQNAEVLFTDKDSWDNQFRVAYNQHAGMVEDQAHWRLNHDEDPEAVQQDLITQLPFEPAERHNLDFLRQRRENPLYRTYLAAYHPAQEAMRPLQAMSEEGQQRALDKLYKGVFLPAQVRDEAKRGR